ncbi:MAG TPA: hypothetical protein VLX29_03020 [Nitrospirota bacterium]|nr:hypothetical protein [Nitrospirota bacterium]
MGICKYCSKPAGLFRDRHKECEEKFLEEKRRKEVKAESDKKEIISVAEAVALGKCTIEELKTKLMSISESFDEFNRKRFLIEAWERAANHCLEESILSKEEESSLMAFLNAFSMKQDDADHEGAYTKLAQAAILRDLMEGKVPQRMTVQGSLPFIFKKDEKLVWLFKGVKYFEPKTTRSFVGGSHGVSIRIARGIYYRVGAFKGHPVETTQTMQLDTGMLGITDQHIYFAGGAISFRVPYGKIVTVTPHSDGISIQRDAANAKPQSFIVGDGWFINNLVANLSKL